MSEDGLHDEHIGEDDDSGGKEVVEDEDDNVVAPGLLWEKITLYQHVKTSMI